MDLKIWGICSGEGEVGAGSRRHMEGSVFTRRNACVWTGEGRRRSKMEEWDEGGGRKGDMEQVREGVTEVETISHSHFQILT